VREIRTLRLTRRGLETGRQGTAPVLDPTERRTEASTQVCLLRPDRAFNLPEGPNM
jgi:hypothetical protein